MTKIHKMTYLFSSSFVFIFNACTPSTIPKNEGGFYDNGIYFGQNLSSSYQKGIQDGCRTSKGAYTKSHLKFNKNQEYNDGWFLGRKKCKYLLKIDENGDLIL